MSKARKRARSAQVSRMKALAEELGGRGLAAEAMKRLQEELGRVTGSDYKLVVDMAACMEKGGVGFYARLMPGRAAGGSGV